MSERRYEEEEVRRIFDAASKPIERRDSPGGSEGLSLGDLKRIGTEVGLSPARIEDAARALDQTPSGPSVRRDFGLPIGVGRTVDLPSEPTDEEWARIVALARRTFDARGDVDDAGRFWWNGNLSVSVEPTASGRRLRLRTTKGDARVMTRLGLAATALGVVTWVAGVIGIDLDIVALNAFFMGVLWLGINAARLVSWSNRRAEQMELVARRAIDILHENEDSDDAGPG